MSDAERRFHEQWLGMAQPYEGLVVSVPVLTEAQCMLRLGREPQQKLLALLESPPPAEGKNAPKSEPRITDLSRLFSELLDLGPERFDRGADLPRPLRLWVPEGRQELRPSCALRWGGAAPTGRSEPPGVDLSAAARAGQDYAMLVWEVPPEVDLDKPETVTGPWEYPAQAKFERLLRECHVPIGLLSNGRELRLVYAPHGESTGWLSFRVADMATVGGRPLLDAFVMLLGRERWFSVSEEQALPALLERSRRHQASVTNALADQVFEALDELLRGFSEAAERAPADFLREAMERGEAHVYSGLLTLLMRLVFCLYAEDRGLLPSDDKLYTEHYSVLGLFQQLEQDDGRYPDSMQRRFGAYPRLVSLFRAIYLGVEHGELRIPPRRGDLFNPNSYPFLEGWGAGSAPITDPEARSAVQVPAVDDGTIYRVLRSLLVLGGQRLSYRALDVEQIGSVYEALMGFDVERLAASAVRIRLGGKRARAWLEGKALLAVSPGRRAAWLADELGCERAVARKIAAATSGAKTEEEMLAALEPFAVSSSGGRRGGKGGADGRERAAAGTLVIQPGLERRRTSSHYTPRELSEAIVHKTLEPLLRALGERPRSEQLLNLVICDPAMGSGAFLVAACRYLADQVVLAWTREAAEGLELFAPESGVRGAATAGRTKHSLLADAHDDVVNHARRLVAQRCLYGVDKNPYAVQLARLSLWLITLARDEPFTFLDHALRHGDSLVGLSFDQIRAFHWKPSQQLETTDRVLREALDEAVDIRRQIHALAADDSPAAQREKQRLLADAEDALARARLIADVVVGAFFAGDKDKARETERNLRLDLVERWLTAKDTAEEQRLEAELRDMQKALWGTQVPFHWGVEFPEVFYQERPDPLDGGKVNSAAAVDAFVGNPPFLGGKLISGQFGDSYSSWLEQLHSASKNADLSAHFFRRAAMLLGKHGTIGLIATNTIGQGDTRATGLQHLVRHGFAIYDATVNLPWPGEAAVTVSVVHLAKGSPAKETTVRLEGASVRAINSRLRPTPERADPQVLAANAGCAFVGTYVLGMGFVLTPEERDALIAKDPHNGERIFPYLGGEEVNTSPTQSHSRHVISFGQMSLDEAERWPDLIGIVREKVKPERDRVKRDAHRKYWWHYADKRPALYAAIAPLERCLVTAIVSKHLIFSFQPTNRVFSHKLYVFPLDTLSSFAVLQSRIHNAWTWLLSSTMKTDLNYSASDCFETFPFPEPDPRAMIAELEAIGQELYEARAAYMVETDQGLTKTYNALKDPSETDPRILRLRALHEELDRAVLRAYPRLPGQPKSDAPGWSDISVPPFCLANPADEAALGAFEDEVLDRLFQLNELRAKEEQALGRAKSGKAGPRSGAHRTTKGDSASGKASTPRRGKKPPTGQGSLGL